MEAVRIHEILSGKFNAAGIRQCNNVYVTRLTLPETKKKKKNTDSVMIQSYSNLYRSTARHVITYTAFCSYTTNLHKVWAGTSLTEKGNGITVSS
jgi:hypothetical protein